MLLTFVGEEVNDIIDELPSEQTTLEKNETHFDKPRPGCAKPLQPRKQH